MKLIDKVKHARRVSVPLVGITTADPMATMRSLANGLQNGPIVAWDCVRGLWGVNTGGDELADVLNEGAAPEDRGGSPMEVLELGLRTNSDGTPRIPAESIIVILQAGAYIERPEVQQGVWNLRDLFKQDRRMLILMDAGLQLPAFIKDDIVLMEDPLPGPDELKAIITDIDAAANKCPVCVGTKKVGGLTCEECKGRGVTKRKPLTGPQISHAIEAVRGLPAFSAEQATAMALRKNGVDIDHLWEIKRKQVEQTRGLSVYRGGEKFAALGGLGAIKAHLSAIMTGRKPPTCIVWLDEVEKTGIAHTGDTSGVNADQNGVLLTEMEDHDIYGVMLLGVPGAGKSAICKAAGAEFGCPVIRLDLGGMQGPHVGESQQFIRHALKVVWAIGGDSTLWLATSNSIDGLDAAMRSRFCDTFFFDLPSKAERSAIWKVWLDLYPDVDGSEKPSDDGWVGRNIRRCVEKAWRMNVSLTDAAKAVLPVGRLEAETIDRLRSGAHKRYLDATREGVYEKPRTATRSRAVDIA